MLLCRNGVWVILYKMSEFRADRSSNMTIIGSSCDLPIRKDLLYGKLIEIWWEAHMEGSVLSPLKIK